MPLSRDRAAAVPMETTQETVVSPETVSGLGAQSVDENALTSDARLGREISTRTKTTSSSMQAVCLVSQRNSWQT